MSDADLIGRLRVGHATNTTQREAADRIEALAGEVERLQRALLFWMPGADLRLDGPTFEHVETDAELLTGYSGPLDGPCWGDGMLDRAESAERALTDYTRHEQTLRDNGIPSHSHAVVMICDLRRALAEAVKVIGFYADEGNWRSLSKGFALQYDPEPSAFQKDRGAAARDFITAQEKEKVS